MAGAKADFSYALTCSGALPERLEGRELSSVAIQRAVMCLSKSDSIESTQTSCPDLLRASTSLPDLKEVGDCGYDICLWDLV